MTTTDALLIQRARSGDAAAVGELYERYQAAIYSYVYYRVGNAAEAEDLVAEVFVRLVTKIHTFQDRGRPILAWLYTIARNLVANHHRRDGSLKWLPLDEALDGVADATVTPAMEYRLTQYEIRAAMDALTEPQRQVVWLKFIEGYSNAEVAAITGRDENAVKSLQHRALAGMRRVMEARESAKYEEHSRERRF